MYVAHDNIYSHQQTNIYLIREDARRLAHFSVHLALMLCGEVRATRLNAPSQLMFLI